MNKNLTVLFFFVLFVSISNASANYNSSEEAQISLSTTSLDLGEIFLNDSRIDRVTLVNTGDEDLILGPLSNTHDYITVFYAGGSSTGGIVLSATDSIDIFVLLSADSLGVYNDQVTITSSVPSVAFNVTASIVNPPVATVTPDSIYYSLNSGDFREDQVSISNTGEADLHYSIAIQYGQESQMEFVSEAFESELGFISKSESSPENYTNFRTKYISRKDATGFLNSVLDPKDPPIEEVLVDFTDDLQSVADIIQNRFDFFDGDIGYSISDGGNDMYDGGNFLHVDGYRIDYSNYAMTDYNPGEFDLRYFTAKAEGLFTLVADFTDVQYFYIAGDLGADGSGNVRVSQFQVEVAGRSFQVFTKQVYNAGDPSVNHIVIFEDDNQITQQYDTYTGSDFHYFEGFNPDTRAYYILFAGENGKEFSQDEFLAITEAYIDLLGLQPPFVSIDENFLTGVLAQDESTDIPIIINTAGLITDTYNAEILITTNDPALLATGVYVTLDVTGTPGIEVLPRDVDFGNVFLNDSTARIIEITNSGVSPLLISEAVFERSEFVFADTISFPLQLEANQSIESQIQFKPTEVTDASSVLTFSSNDPNDSLYTINLAAFGVEPPVITVDPTELAFTLNSGDSLESSFSISNIGESDLYYELEHGFGNNSSGFVTGNDQKVYFSVRYYKGTSQRAYGTIFEYDLVNEVYTDTIYIDALREVNYYVERFTVTNDVIYLMNPRNQYQILYFDLNTREQGVFYENSEYQYYSVAGTNEYLYALTGNLTTSIHKIDLETGEFIAWMNNNYYWWDITAKNEDELYSIKDYRELGLIDFANNQDSILSILPDDEFYYIASSGVDGAAYVAGYQWSNDQGIFLVDVVAGEFIDTVATGEFSDIFGLATSYGGNGDYFTLISQESDTVGVGLSNDVNFKLNASDMLGGVYDSQFIISTNDPLNSELTVPIEFTVVGIPEIDVLPDSVYFEDTYISDTDASPVLIQNPGTDTLRITGITFSDTQFLSENELPIIVAPRDDFQIDILFQPTQSGEQSSSVTFESNATNNPSFTIQASAIGLDPPVIVVDEQPITETVAAGDSVSGAITITNNGLGELNYIIKVTSGQELGEEFGTEAKNPFTPEFKTTSSSNGGRLFGIAYLENSTLLHVVEISRVDGSYINTIPTFTTELYGPEGLAFDSEYLYFYSPVDNSRITVYDPVENVEVRTLSIPGRSYDALAHSGEILYALDYNNDTIYGFDPEDGTGLVTLYVGEGIVGGMTFGGERGTIFVSNGSNLIYEVDTDSGNVINSIPSPNENFDGGLGYSVSTGTLFTITYNNETGSNAIYELDPDNGEIISTIDTDAISLALASNEAGGPPFVAINSPLSGTVEPSSSVDIDYTLRSEGLLGGDYFADIRIESNDPINDELSVPVQLTVVGEPRLSFDVDTLDFGQVITRNSTTKTLNFNNIGNDDLIIESIAIEGEEFTIDSLSAPFTIDPFSSLNVNLNYRTTDVIGFDYGEITIISNSVDSSTTTVKLKGETVVGAMMSFEMMQIETSLKQGDSASFSMDITNTGDVDLILSLDSRSGLFDQTTASIPNVPGIQNNESRNFILVIEDQYSWNISVSDVVWSRISPEDSVTRIASYEIGDINLYDYDVIITASIQSSSYYLDLENYITAFEDYISEGGFMFYSVSTLDIAVLLPGEVYGSLTLGYAPFHDIIDIEHPIMQDLPSDFFNEQVGSLGHFELGNTSLDVNTLLVDKDNQYPIIIEYPLGDGRVLGSTYALEFMHYRGTLPDQKQEYYNRVIDYVLGEFQEMNSWIKHDKSEIVVAPSETKTIELVLDANGMDIGNYSAHIIATNNQSGMISETVIAEINLEVTMGTNAEEFIDGIPTEPELSQNYPNPFNPTTAINYGIPETGNVRLVVFNLLGQEVQTLVNSNKQAGRYIARFDASRLSSGMYFYQLYLDGIVVETKQMMLIK